MDSHPDNPASNSIPGGMGAARVREAIKESGYPLQTQVAADLNGEFLVTEEFAYLDRDSGERRQMDILAEREMYDSNDLPAVQTEVALIIECKRSNLPYVFFRQVAGRDQSDYPILQGKTWITVSDSLGGTRAKYSVRDYMPIESQPFVTDVPDLASVFTRCTPSSSSLSVSGDMPYRKVILPLVSAIEHYQSIHPYRNERTNPLVALFGMCVTDAPMLLYDELSDSLTYVPWIRVQRVESGTREVVNERYWIDVVHVAYLQSFIDKLLEFASWLETEALRHSEKFGARVHVEDDESIAPGDLEFE